MTSTIQHTKGNRNPSLTDRITVDGVVVDLSASTVKLKMRPIGSATLKIDASATTLTPVLPTDPNVRYDWAALDVDTSDTYLAWWEVTTTGKTQDTPEFLVYMTDHAAGTGTYLKLDELKNTLSLTNQSYPDEDLKVAIDAASRGLEDAYETRWVAPMNDIRYYTRSGSRSVHLGDVQSITQVALDYSYTDVYSDGRVWDWDTGLGSYTTILDPTWYRLLPIEAGAPGNGEPYQTLQLNRASQRLILPSGTDAIRITGSFGWVTTPPGVKAAVSIIASRLLRRTREAPFGIVAVGLDGASFRAGQIANDPEVRFVMKPVSGTQTLFV